MPSPERPSRLADRPASGTARLEWIDTLRGVATLLVLVLHAGLIVWAFLPDFHPAGLDFREVQQVVDQLEQAKTVGQHRLEERIIPADLLAKVPCHDAFYGAQQESDGSSELVGDIRKEVRFSAVQLGQLFV